METVEAEKDSDRAMHKSSSNMTTINIKQMRPYTETLHHAQQRSIQTHGRIKIKIYFFRTILISDTLFSTCAEVTQSNSFILF